MSYMRPLKHGEAGGKRKEGEEQKKEKEREAEGERLCCMSLPLEGCRGRGREEEGGRGGSLTSARLEPQWLARIQPHSAFDEAWILELNQSHMSPTERETEMPERLGEGDRGGGRDGERVQREGWRTGKE